MPVADEFAELMATTDPTMVIATASVDGAQAGCLVGFSTQCSIDPPRYLAFISDKNRTHRVATRASTVAIHFLDERERDLAELFGGETGDDVDKFSQVDWRDVAGAPVLDRCTRWFVGRVLDRIDPGDHCGLLLEPVDASVLPPPDDELSYQDVKDLEPGHRP